MTTMFEAATFLRDRLIRSRLPDILIQSGPSSSPTLFDGLVVGGAEEALEIEAGLKLSYMDATMITGIDRWWELDSEQTGGTAPTSGGKSGAPEWMLYE